MEDCLISFRFADSDYWLEYFPPLTKSDLQSMGLKVNKENEKKEINYKNNILYIAIYLAVTLLS